MAKKSKARQLRMPGTEGDVDKEVHAAGLAYTKKRDKRMDLSAEEKSAKVALIAVMKRKGVTAYKDTEADPPVVIVLSSKDNVKVTEIDDDELDEALPPAETDDGTDDADDGSDDAGTVTPIKPKTVN